MQASPARQPWSVSLAQLAGAPVPSTVAARLRDERMRDSIMLLAWCTRTSSVPGVKRPCKVERSVWAVAPGDDYHTIRLALHSAKMAIRLTADLWGNLCWVAIPCTMSL